jgi:hypothetical protein
MATVVLQGDPDANNYLAAGQELDKNSVKAGLALDMPVGRVSFNLGYEGVFSMNTKSHNGALRFTVQL